MTDSVEFHARPKIIGARITRTEDPRLLTGFGAYVDDRQTLRVLHVAFRRSEHSHARIRKVDCAVARAAPGVVAVLTAEVLVRAITAKGGAAKAYQAEVANFAAVKAMVEINCERPMKLSPVCRLGLTGDVAPMVALLASPQSGWITGQALSIGVGFAMV